VLEPEKCEGWQWYSLDDRHNRFSFSGGNDKVLQGGKNYFDIEK